MGTIEAIETSYAGCRFRSRLEARWAVFFDHLDLRWDYEPQGYLVGEAGRPYLPDFWLPDLETWAEVKGETAALDMSLMKDAVGYPHGLGRSDSYGEISMLILGPVPAPADFAYLHAMLSHSAYAPCPRFCACADVNFSQVAFHAVPPAALELPEAREAEAIGVRMPPALLTQWGRSLLHPLAPDVVAAQPCMPLRPGLKVVAAYRAARSARFEHGESGAA
jgi:hypothetical protein